MFAKILWTGPLVLVGLVAFPIYWFRVMLRDYREPTRSLEATR